MATSEHTDYDERVLCDALTKRRTAGHGITIERWQTDNAWTYTHNTKFKHLLAANGIRHRTIAPRTPKHNGKVCVLGSSGRPAGRRGSPLLLV